MSNCIRILNDVAIPLDQITEPQMLMAHVAAAGRGPFPPTYTDTWAWFLTPDTVSIDGDLLIISFGEGRSSHTWRDFKATIYALSQYLVPNVYLPLEITDEYDGYEEVLRIHAQPHTMKLYRGRLA